MTDVKTCINDKELSLFKVFLDVEGAPDTHNPNLPGSPTVRPAQVMLMSYPEDGIWEVSMALVRGPKVHATAESLTKRHYDATFMNPMDPGSGTPPWLLRICQERQDRLNADLESPAFLIYTSGLTVACEHCCSDILLSREDVRLDALIKATRAHVCDPAKVARVERYLAARDSDGTV